MRGERFPKPRFQRRAEKAATPSPAEGINSDNGIPAFGEWTEYPLASGYRYAGESHAIRNPLYISLRPILPYDHDWAAIVRSACSNTSGGCPPEIR